MNTEMKYKWSYYYLGWYVTRVSAEGRVLPEGKVSLQI